MFAVVAILIGFEPARQRIRVRIEFSRPFAGRVFRLHRINLSEPGADGVAG